MKGFWFRFFEEPESFRNACTCLESYSSSLIVPSESRSRASRVGEKRRVASDASNGESLRGGIVA